MDKKPKAKYRLIKRFYSSEYDTENHFWFDSKFVESNTEFFEKVTPKLWKPKEGAYYWFAAPVSRNVVGELVWNNDYFDKRLLERGLVFPTKEQAIAHAEYLIECSLKKRMEDLEK